MQDRAVADVAVLLDDRVGAGKAVHHAVVLDVGAGAYFQPPEVAAQARERTDVNAGPDDHVADQHGGRMHERRGIDHRRDAVDRVDASASSRPLALSRQSTQPCARCGTSASTASPRPTPSGCHDICTVRKHALGMRHQDREAAVGGGQPGDALRRAVRDWRDSASVALPRGVDEAQRDQRLAPQPAAPASRNSAQPSPCAIATGMRLPSMPAKNSDGDGAPRPARGAPRTARLGCARSAASAPAPGMSSRSSAIIWQPLQTPSAKCRRARRTRRSRRAPAVEQDRLRPALAGAEHVAVGEAAAGDEARGTRRASAGRPAGRSCARRRRRSRRGRTRPPSRPGR